MNMNIVTKIKACAKSIDKFIELKEVDLSNFYLGNMLGMIETAYECGAIPFEFYQSMIVEYSDYLDRITDLEEGE